MISKMKYTYLVVGIIVVILIFATFSAVRNRLPQIGQFIGATPAPSVEKTTIASVTISKHTPASTAVVDSTTLTQNGFVTIHDDQNGNPGGVLGASELLQAGTHENLVIKLTRKTQDGEKLFAVVHKDDGNGQLDPQNDEVLKDDSGNTVQAIFEVSSIDTSGDTNGFQIPATGLGEDDN